MTLWLPQREEFTITDQRIDQYTTISFNQGKEVGHFNTPSYTKTGTVYGANRLNTTNLDSGQIGREIFKKLSCKFYGPNNYFMSNFGHNWSQFGIFRPFQLIR